MSRVFITDQGHDRIIVRTLRRNPAFTEDLKRSIPSRSREWSPEGRRWFINRECRARVEAIARRHFDDVEIREAA